VLYSPRTVPESVEGFANKEELVTSAHNYHGRWPHHWRHHRYRWPHHRYRWPHHRHRWPHHRYRL
jgi:hypothetical protein